MQQDKNQICTLRIMFPVTSDEKAIEAKQKVEAALADVSDVNTQFSIVSMPKGKRSDMGIQ